MRILLAGGVFGNRMEEYALSAPENVLRTFLAEQGHDVVATPTARPVPRGIHADCYHVHHWGEAAYQLAFERAAPFLFTSHDPFLVSGYAASESRLARALQALVLGHAQVVVALAQAEADRLADRFELDPARFVVIPNGLDLSLYSAGDHAEGSGLRLLSVGQLAEYKGHRHLIEAVARVAGTLDVRLHVVSHQETLRPQLAALCDRLGIRERVTFEGALSTPELVERYRACDIYVQPSLADLAPVTITEAMACGRPVVATSVGGIPELVGDAGVIVPPRDAAALAHELGRLGKDLAERRRLGEAGLARVTERNDGRRVASLHAELYAEVAARVGHERRGSLPRRALALAGLAVLRRKEPIARLVPEFVRRRPVATG